MAAVPECRARAGRAGATGGSARSFIPPHPSRRSQAVERQSPFRRAQGIPAAGAHRRPLSKPGRPGHGLREIFGILCQGTVAGDERGALRGQAGLRLGNHFDHGDHQGVVLAADGGEHAFDERMQPLAPEMAALKEKYKDDMQKFTQKQWELYRKHKVSPMSGCLPMAIQMPVFFGFFQNDLERD